MQLIQRNKDSAYLQYDKYVDYDNPIVAAKAKDHSNFDERNIIYLHATCSIPLIPFSYNTEGAFNEGTAPALGTMVMTPSEYGQGGT